MNTKPEPNHDYDDHLDHDDERKQTVNTKPDPNRDHDDHLDHANDNNDDVQRAVAPAPTAGALAALTALTAGLNKVDTSSVIGRSGMPMMQFKREGDGSWSYGQKRITVETNSRWAVNPTTFQWGYVCFGEGNKWLGDRVVPVTQEMPDVTALPDKGFPWVPQWSVNLKCLDGADTGVEVTFKSTTDGGIKAVAGLIETVRDRLNGGQHGGHVAPIVQLRKDSYAHSQYGRVWFPVFDLVDWMPMGGPAPAPTPDPTPEPEPRRRRVG
jgi:hypothetical protein